MQFVHIVLKWKNHNEPWPAKKYNYDQLDEVILKRANEASGLYQMFGNLRDMIVLDRCVKWFYIFGENKQLD